MAHLQILLARKRAHQVLQVLGVSDRLFQQPAPSRRDVANETLSCELLARKFFRLPCKSILQSA